MEHWAPTRVRWDVDFRGRAGRPKRIARQIREIAPRFVELRFESDRGIDELSGIFTEIHQCHPQVEATVGLTAKATAATRWGYPIHYIWAVDGRETFSRCIPPEARAVSFSPDEETIVLLPEVLQDFAESGAVEMHLPNINAVRALASVGHIPAPRPGQIREASEKLARSRIPMNGKRIVVHDPLLCRLLRDVFPEGTANRVVFSDCRAGTDLVYVDWDGNVYPCDSLPIRLGNLIESPFERIWRSPARRRVVDAIRQLPREDGSSGPYADCLGGCRGLAYFASGSFGKGEPRDSEEAAATSPKTR